MKFNVILDRDEDGVWIVQCPSIPGCVSQGKTKDEALTNIREAIALCLEVRSEKGMPLTVETRQVEVIA
ncbi:MAG: type II toxin-antitoxin system HicB family antitoxin [Selenomonadales bacterium]|jgi:predicted RNase H-like HicB family nuclease|nr:type II toxin-antitoxin system HicB family antitoxin [Selenomonadales bacterium]